MEVSLIFFLCLLHYFQFLFSIVVWQNGVVLSTRTFFFFSLFTGQSLEHFDTGLCDNKSYRLEVPEDHKGTLDSIWYKATEMCHSGQLKNFLRKKGKLSSLHVDRSTACNFLYVLSSYSFFIHLKISCIIA